jgi:TIR domain
MSYGQLIRSKDEIINDLDVNVLVLSGIINNINELQYKLRNHEKGYSLFQDRYNLGLDFGGSLEDAVSARLEELKKQKNQASRQIDLWVDISFDANSRDAVKSKLFPNIQFMFLDGNISYEIQSFQRSIERFKDELEDLRQRIPYFEDLKSGKPKVKSFVKTESDHVEREKSNIFIAYSHADKKWLDRIETHLTPLKRSGTIHVWNDQQLKPGQKWREEIEQALKLASVAVLLVSADFLASDFVVSVELPTLLAAEKNKGLRVIPVFVAPAHVPQEILIFQGLNGPDTTFAELENSKVDRFLSSLVKQFQ